MDYKIINQEEECLTPRDISRILNISKAQSYRLFNSKIEGEEFNGFKVGNSWRISRLDFQNWLNSKTDCKGYEL